jgi:dTDP-4-dehydrorhamnose reductase
VSAPLELWGGVECTINRVGDQYRDQLELGGHYVRAEADIDRLAAIGIRAVRWPILWERHSGPHAVAAWAHTDRMLARLRAHGIRVIAGLLHHGSGPPHTSLVDPALPRQLAEFAREVAIRHPWIDAWTPVNEPLTTARFAGLYGLWYPHARQDRAFVLALVQQVLATQSAMQAVHTVQPAAQLIATEDLGYSHANAAVRYQAAFENERRWLTWDLLFGLVKRGHPLWNFLVRSGPIRRLLDQIADQATDHAARPAIVGVNHYVTSERFLDEALTFYPPRTHGGNKWHRYADVEAVRVLRDGPLGPARLLLQAWARYGAPLAITEAHLGCTREQQMQWVLHMWRSAEAARAGGADVRAVTAWALFGSFDWRSLLTRSEHAYESGAWDVRAPTPRPTALVSVLTALANGAEPAHPALAADAWWTRPDRLEYPPRRSVATHDGSTSAAVHTAPRGRIQPLLILGAGGTLGVAMQRLARERGLPFVARTRREVDIADPDAVRRALETIRPWAVVNTAGWVRVDDAEHEREACRRANVTGADVVARLVGERALPLCTFSSDLVFGTTALRPFVESDLPAPRNHYGHSKLEAERRVLAQYDRALVVRTSAFFGDWDDANFVTRTLAMVHRGRDVLAPTDAVVSPTYVTDLGHACLDLLIDGAGGLWHLANVGACTWFELAQRAASMAGLDASRIAPCSSRDIGWVAPRPAYSVLGSERATLLPSLDDALARHLRMRAWERLARRQHAAAPVAPVALRVSHACPS